MTNETGLIKVNGRTRFFSHLHGFTQTGKSEYTVYRNDTRYTIYGGKHAGGRRNEWFVKSASWDKSIYTKSIIDSLNLLENM